MPALSNPLSKISLHTGFAALHQMGKGRTILHGLAALHRSLGDSFRIPLPGFNPVVVAGPGLLRDLLVRQREAFRWRNEADPVTQLLREGLLVLDGEAHLRMRRRMEPALRRSRVLDQVEVMAAYTDQVVSAWKEGSIQDLQAGMRRLTLLILVQSQFGVDLNPDLDRLWGPILRSIDFISPGLWLVAPGLPRPGYRHAVETLDRYLYRLIQERRQYPGDPEDLLGRLIRDPALTDGQVRDQLMTILIAGHDTSTALLTWALFLMAAHPAVLSQARQEARALLGHDLPTPDSLPRLTYLERVIKETLRLYPPIHAGNRLAVEDTEIGGRTIPAGTRVMASYYLTHRAPDVWPDPERFIPERFQRESPNPHGAFSYLPFGGGPRNCIGAAFAQVEAKVVLARILQTVDFNLVTPSPGVAMKATLEPKTPVLVHIEGNEISG